MDVLFLHICGLFETSIFLHSKSIFTEDLVLLVLRQSPCHGIQGVLLSAYGFAFWGGFPHRFPSFEKSCYGGASYGLDYHVALIYGCLVAPHEDAGYAHVALKNSERCAWPTVWLGACVTCCLVDFMTKPVFQRKPWDEIKATK